MSTSETQEEIPFEVLEYVGGGYFRDRRIPKGETSPIIHGPEMLRRVCNIQTQLTAAKADNSKLWHERNAAIEGGWERLKIYIDKHHKEHCQKYITSRDAWKKMAGELADLIRIEVPSMNCSCEGCLKGPARTLVNTYQKLLEEDGG